MLSYYKVQRLIMFRMHPNRRSQSHQTSLPAVSLSHLLRTPTDYIYPDTDITEAMKIPREVNQSRSNNLSLPGRTLVEKLQSVYPTDEISQVLSVVFPG